jgi:hypothetical protein
LIKPSHYDDDGYVVQWLRGAIPSNTLAVLYGLALECKEQRVLGEDVELDIIALDETNTRIRPDRIARNMGGRAGWEYTPVHFQTTPSRDDQLLFSDFVREHDNIRENPSGIWCLSSGVVHDVWQVFSYLRQNF